MYNVLLMEGRQNVWSPWYLMPKDKIEKVECKFYSNVILYCKNIMFLHLGYWYDGNGRIGIIVCSKAHPWLKALFACCDRLVPPPLNNMEVLAHISGKQRMWPWKHWIFSWKENLLRGFKWKRLKIPPLLQIAQKALIDPQIKTLEPFNMFHCPRNWIQPKNKIWTRSGQVSFMRQTSHSMLCNTQHS
jgi:hypothetical protein